MREQLRKPLPTEAITKHPTKTYLSSIKNIYIVERLNDVFGVGSWTQKSKVISVHEGMVVVHSELTIPEYGIQLESFGGNDNGGEGSKNFDLGDAYKGACTDALSKICSFLEIAIDVFKGNGNKPTVDPKKTEAPKTPEPPKTPTPPQQPQGNKNGAKLLNPSVPLWNTVISGLKEKGKKSTDWPTIKFNYHITENDEKLLFKEMNW